MSVCPWHADCNQTALFFVKIMLYIYQLYLMANIAFDFPANIVRQGQAGQLGPIELYLYRNYGMPIYGVVTETNVRDVTLLGAPMERVTRSIPYYYVTEFENGNFVDISGIHTKEEVLRITVERLNHADQMGIRLEDARLVKISASNMGNPDYLIDLTPDDMALAKLWGDQIYTRLLRQISLFRTVPGRRDPSARR